MTGSQYYGSPLSQAWKFTNNYNLVLKLVQSKTSLYLNVAL